MRGFGDIIASSGNKKNRKEDSKEDQFRRTVGSVISSLGLEAVNVDKTSTTIQYTCRPRVDRELLLNRVQRLISHNSIRMWQEWLLKGNKMVVAVVIELNLAEFSGVVPHMRKVARDTIPDKKEIDIPIKLDHRPKAPFDLSANGKSPGIGGVHPLGAVK